MDLRDNNIQVAGLSALNDAVKCNKSITQIDLNATPVTGGGVSGVATAAGERDADVVRECHFRNLMVFYN